MEREREQPGVGEGKRDSGLFAGPVGHYAIDIDVAKTCSVFAVLSVLYGQRAQRSAEPRQSNSRHLISVIHALIN